MAIDGIEHEAVARAARNFISGSVKGHNRSFAPSCAEFSEECRTMQATIQAERRPRLPKPEKVDAGPRVAPWKLKLLQQALGGDNTAREKLRKMFPAIDIPDAPEPASEEERGA